MANAECWLIYMTYKGINLFDLTYAGLFVLFGAPYRLSPMPTLETI
ncbi:hypothetical protein AVDCRST_MAG84-1769 [uncultured Microcoleus sp.]|uniref:Uncharacterized protein n=1 Tax=uncultured Microcoleus sp. TaxID=259945 RepID=A0A6J4LHB4_9CYAN|nr:hypothetical protein AVDCRST_MAG84-1769 [uncultured Microcoleus sp.]